MTPRENRKIPIIWTNNKSQPIAVADFRDIVLTVVGTGTAQVLGSAQENYKEVDFTVTSTLDNAFAPIVLADLTAANTYATSIAVSASTKLAEVNTNLLTWICVTRSVDTMDGYVSLSDNQ